MTEEIKEVAPEAEATNDAVVETEVETTESQPDEGAKKAAEPEKEPDAEDAKRKSRHQRRKEQAERQRQENEALAAKLKEANARLKEIDEYSASTKPPKEDDFDSLDEYQAALSAHKAMQMMDARQKRDFERQAEAHRQEMERLATARKAELASEWRTQVSEARARYADFDKVALNPAIPITPQIAEMVAQMDAGADVVYHLGMNPADAARIATLSPLEAAMELGRIEARLSVPKPKTVTNAPDPVNPVKGKSPVEKDYRDMTPDEYDAWRDAGGVPT